MVARAKVAEAEAAAVDRVHSSSDPEWAVVALMDMVGYSRLTALDEVSTHANWHTIQDNVIYRLVARHQGRVVKVGGDEVLMAFQCATSGIACAIELQHEVATYNAQILSDRRLLFRIGVHLGHVLVEDSDLFGNAVNIAARLQTLADPGGVVISLAVLDQLAEKLRRRFEDLGAIPLKNIPDPVRAFRWRDNPTSEAPAPFRVPLKPPVDRPSVAVLPFANVGSGESSCGFKTEVQRPS